MRNYKKAIFRVKIYFFTVRILEAKNCLQELFKVINEISEPDCLKSVATNPDQFVQTLAQYFVNTVTSIHASLSHCALVKPQIGVEAVNAMVGKTNVFRYSEFQSVTQNELVKLMVTSKDSSPPSDPCPGKIQKINAGTIGPVVTDIINASFSE